MERGKALGRSTQRLRAAAIGAVACAIAIIAASAALGASTSQNKMTVNDWLAKAATNPHALAGTSIRAITVDVSPTTTLKQVIGDFTAKTGIKVNIETYNEDTVRQKEVLDFTSHSRVYDVDTVEWWFTPEFANAHYLVSINSLLKSGTVKGWLSVKDFPGRVLDGFRYQGTLWAVPYWEIAGLYYYRTDIFNKLDVKPPKTIADIITIAKKTKAANLGLYGWSGRGNRSYDAFGSVAGFAAAYGAKLLDSKGQPTLLTDPRWHRAMTDWLTLMQNYAPPGAGSATWYDAYQTFQQSKVSQFFDTSDYGPALESPKDSKVLGKVGYMPPPVGPAGKRMQWFYAEGFGINKAVSPKQQAAAWLFLQWRSSPQTFLKELQVKHSPRFDEPSLTVLNSPKYLAAAGKAKMVAYVTGLRDALKVADPRYWPNIPSYAEVGAAIAKDVSDGIASHKTATQVLQAANADTLKVLAGK
jgi:multiple sugar transport system substrate-binding protein